MDNDIALDENVARFILAKSYFRPSNKTVKHNAFMPHKGSGTTSIFRIINLADIEIYEIGRNFVANPRGKPLLGRADIGVSQIIKQNLSVEPDPTPHPRHANICGWTEDPSKNKMIAIELAAEAQLHLVDNSG